MARKNELVQFAGHFQAVAGELSRRLEKKGVKVVEAISRLAQPGTEKELDEIERVLVGLVQTIPAPPGGRVYLLRVRVNWDRPWTEAVRGAGPNTPDNYDVWKVGDQYPPDRSDEKEEKEIVLVNFGRFAEWSKIVAWGKANRLRETSPRVVFAVGEKHPNLNRDLGMPYMGVVATKTCSFGGEQYAPSVWWYEAEREADVSDVAHRWHDLCWFAFLRE